MVAYNIGSLRRKNLLTISFCTSQIKRYLVSSFCQKALKDVYGPTVYNSPKWYMSLSPILARRVQQDTILSSKQL